MTYSIKRELGTLTVPRTLKAYLRHPLLMVASDRKQWQEFAALKRMERAGLAKMYNTATFPTGAYYPDWADLWNIYTLVKSRKPKVIVECGAGCSTLMIAAAVRDLAREGHQAEFWSFDESLYWMEKLKGYMPPDLLQLVRLEHRDTKAVEIAGQQCITFADLPPLLPNFLYVDGPLAVLPGALISVGIEFAKDAPADYFILIDGLGKTYRFYQAQLGSAYRYEENRVHW